MKSPSRAAAALAALLLAGCGMFGIGGKSNEYKSAQSRAAQPLEVPPELTAPTSDDRYAIPDPRAQTSYSTYSQRAIGTPAAAGPGGPTVLPKVEGARMERVGDQRWLVVKGPPESVWPLLVEFWNESGFTLAREEPQAGIMETNWYEDRSRISDDIVRRTIGRFIENVYSTPRRDKFRTRVEKGAEPNTTEVFVSNRNVEEVFPANNQERTVWQPRTADREAEAEMLSRMLVKLGAKEQEKLAAAAQAARNPQAPAATAAAPGAPAARNAVLENGGNGPLVVNDSFDRAWRRVGLALDRVGFTVEDRDRSKGLFFVRYIDPEVDVKQRQGESFVDKLLFWRAAPRAAQPQYRIHVADAGASMSQVQVQNAQGAAESSSTGKRILSLLYDQLK